MGNDKTDPTGLSALTGKPFTIPALLVLVLVGPGAGFKLAESTDDHGAQIAALDARISALQSRIDALALHDVRLDADVDRLADTIGEVRKIEEQAHPRFRSPPDSP